MPKNKPKTTSFYCIQATTPDDRENWKDLAEEPWFATLEEARSALVGFAPNRRWPWIKGLFTRIVKRTLNWSIEEVVGVGMWGRSPEELQLISGVKSREKKGCDNEK